MLDGGSTGAGSRKASAVCLAAAREAVPAETPPSPFRGAAETGRGRAHQAPEGRGCGEDGMRCSLRRRGQQPLARGWCSVSAGGDMGVQPRGLS